MRVVAWSETPTFRVNACNGVCDSFYAHFAHFSQSREHCREAAEDVKNGPGRLWERHRQFQVRRPVSTICSSGDNISALW